MHRKIALISIITSFIGSFFTPTAMAYEEPKYQVLVKSDEFEIRQYAPMLIAEVTVDGDMDQASNKGFRLIADYIFGNNQVAGKSENEKISMTAPVTIEPVSKKIEMTTPVTISPSGDDFKAGQWRVNFVMPSQYNLNNIPKPNNSQVTLKQIPEKYFVINSYSGFNTQSRVQDKSNQTIAWINQQGLKAISAPQLSRYDPPWTLPMFRRNEIMVEINKPSSLSIK